MESACTAYESTRAERGNPIADLAIREPFVLCSPARTLAKPDPEDDGPAPLVRPTSIEVLRLEGARGSEITALTSPELFPRGLPTGLRSVRAPRWLGGGSVR